MPVLLFFPRIWWRRIGFFKGQRRRVDAIAQTGGFRAVVENVAQMAAAMRANDFRAAHPQTVILPQNYCL